MPQTQPSHEAIKEFWDSQVAEHGPAIEATNPDRYATDLEIKAITPYLHPGNIVADVGCGNGFSTFHYPQLVPSLSIHGYDYSEDMIKQANQSLEEMIGLTKTRINFSVGNVLDLKDVISDTYDRVINDRCLINLTTREEQAQGMKEMYRILKPGGLYIMCECFEEGLANLNVVRKEVNLPEINTRWHNLYMDHNHVMSTMENLGATLHDENHFASFYFLASRVINGGIAQRMGTDPAYDSAINEFASKVSHFLHAGNYSALKIMVFKKP